MPHTLKNVLPATAKIGSSAHLEVGGCDTVDLAREFGTPLLVFCEETFRQKARSFKAAFEGSGVFYAAKAFSSLAICKLAHEEGLGIDVASGGELHTALKAGFPPERLVFHGNNKLDSEIRLAVEARVGRIAIDNLDDVSRVGSAAAAAGKTQHVLLRVTPGVEAHTHEYIETGKEDSKFGLSIEGGIALDGIRAIEAHPSLELLGIHAHIGSNIFSYDPFAKTIEILFEFLGTLREERVAVQEINLGGGIGIPYVAGDYPVNLDLMGTLVKETAEREAKRNEIESPKLSFEPGRYLIGNAMLTLYSAGVIKEVPGIRTYLSVDGGMSDNIRPALYHAHYTALVANKPSEDTSKLVTIAGMHCESGDILVRDVQLAASVTRGDIIAVPATGAYTYSMASNYNRLPRPAVVSVKEGKARVIVRRESLDDLMRLDEF